MRSLFCLLLLLFPSFLFAQGHHWVRFECAFLVTGKIYNFKKAKVEDKVKESKVIKSLWKLFKKTDNLLEEQKKFCLKLEKRKSKKKKVWSFDPQKSFYKVVDGKQKNNHRYLVEKKSKRKSQRKKITTAKVLQHELQKTKASSPKKDKKRTSLEKAPIQKISDDELPEYIPVLKKFSQKQKELQKKSSKPLRRAKRIPSYDFRRRHLPSQRTYNSPPVSQYGVYTGMNITGTPDMDGNPFNDL